MLNFLPIYCSPIDLLSTYLTFTSTHYHLCLICRVSEANESTPILLDVDECIDYDEPDHILRCSYSTTDLGGCSHEYDAAVQCGKHDMILIILTCSVNNQLSSPKLAPLITSAQINLGSWFLHQT